MTKNYFAEIGDIREKINSKQSQTESIESAPLPLSDVEAKLNNLFSENAELPGLGSFFFPNQKTNPFKIQTSPGQGLLSVVNGIVCGHKGDFVDLANFLIPLFGEQLKKQLLTALKAEAAYFDEPGLPVKDRPAAINKLLDEIHALEIEEEAVICEAAEALVFIARRCDVDPKIVLMMPAEVTA